MHKKQMCWILRNMIKQYENFEDKIVATRNKLIELEQHKFRLQGSHNTSEKEVVQAEIVHQSEILDGLHQERVDIFSSIDIGHEELVAVCNRTLEQIRNTEAGAFFNLALAPSTTFSWDEGK